MTAARSPFQPSGLLYGVAYYPEYHFSDRLALDLDLMVEAHLNVIRVGESVWSTWEPRDGAFDLEWLGPVLDAAHERGLKVILGTPTYAVPPWLQVAHPEIAAERTTGHPIAWGARQEADFSHPVFRRYAERVIRAVTERYAGHPSVIGYQVDNEPGLELFHNEHVFESFTLFLQDRYGDVENLNREWGLTYWSHRLTEWDQLWRPDGNSFPQYDLAWRTFQAQVTSDYIGWQADIVREYARPDQFVTTCLQYPRPALDDRLLATSLDVISGNPYYGMQDRLAAGVDLPQLNTWTTTGVAGLFRQADRIFATSQQRYLVTETNAQSIGPADVNFPPYPGQLKQSAFAFLSRGAAMIEYWHWHTIPYGAETYWGGVLPHSLVPGRIYDEVSQIGADLSRIGASLDEFRPDADIALVWSVPSRFALQFMPPFNIAGVEDIESYEHGFDAFHRGVLDSGRQARIFHLEQAEERGAAHMAAAHPVLIVAGAYVLTDDQLAFLRDYAAAGGHLILGVKTGYADEEARVRVAVAPATLEGGAGVHYEEYSNLEAPVAVTAVGDALIIPDGAAGTLWIDGLIADGAEVVAGYEHPRFGDFPAVTTRAHGSGRITVVGTVPSPELAGAIAAWAVPAPVASDLADAVALPLTVMSGRGRDDTRVYFVFNWGWEAQSLTLARSVTDPTTGDRFAAGHELSLAGWDSRILIGERDNPGSIDPSH